MRQTLKYADGWDVVVILFLGLGTIMSFIGYFMSIQSGSGLPWLPVIFMVFSYGYWDYMQKKAFLTRLMKEPQPKSSADILIAELAAKGFLVLNRSNTQVQFSRKKHFSFFWSLAWLCVFFVGVVVYILYYMSKKDEVLTVTFEDKPTTAPAMTS